MWRSFFIIVVLFLFLAIFAGGIMGSVNLTNTPMPLPGGSGSASPLLGGPAQPGLVGEGGCGGSYTVRAGDTLSAIAQGCGVALEDLIAANPGLANPNLIHPGQVLVIAAPRPATAPPPAAQPVPSPTAAPAILPVATAAPAPPTPTAAPSVRPGDAYAVHLGGLPPNAPVAVLLGPLGFAPSEVGRGAADARGVYTGSVQIPTSALPGAKWRVTVQTLAEPVIEVNSPTVIIQP